MRKFGLKGKMKPRTKVLLNVFALAMLVYWLIDILTTANVLQFVFPTAGILAALVLYTEAEAKQYLTAKKYKSLGLPEVVNGLTLVAATFVLVISISAIVVFPVPAFILTLAIPATIATGILAIVNIYS